MIRGDAPIDPYIFGGATALLLLAACTAAFLPARRAVKANPVEALRVQ